ncbi:aminodeoxychorismate synthase component I [Streptomyces sp. NPDC016172]|uniref:aminodeoxychorismate synthase component I n=1 Tax=Streptomyces sp. NPDC016172 TaxID=3364964 RepID=UPI0037025FB4
MKTLLIDNYDSYTYNLFQLLAEVNGEEPVVVRNDTPVDGLPDLRAFDNLVVSPGPGHPGEARDFGIGGRLLATSPVPVLGVCLGHQGIALGEAGLVGPAPEPRHGHLSTIRHDGRDLFHGLPQQFTAVRYHSLAVREPLPDTLEATAWAEDGVLMGLRHRSRPLWGVQFHPESVLTEYGHRMLVNFRNLTAERAGKLRTKNTAVPSHEQVRRRVVVPECDAGARRPLGGLLGLGGLRRPVAAAVFQVAAVTQARANGSGGPGATGLGETTTSSRPAPSAGVRPRPEPLASSPAAVTPGGAAPAAGPGAGPEAAATAPAAGVGPRPEPVASSPAAMTPGGTAPAAGPGAGPETAATAPAAGVGPRPEPLASSPAAMTPGGTAPATGPGAGPETAATAPAAGVGPRPEPLASSPAAVVPGGTAPATGPGAGPETAATAPAAGVRPRPEPLASSPAAVVPGGCAPAAGPGTSPEAVRVPAAGPGPHVEAASSNPPAPAPSGDGAVSAPGQRAPLGATPVAGAPTTDASASPAARGRKTPAEVAPDSVAIPRPRRPDRVGYRLHTRRVSGAVDAEAVFSRMFAGSPRSFWLDSSLVEPGRSRFSFLGDDQGPLAEFVRYDVGAGRCEIERAGRPVRRVRASVFDYLQRQLTNRRVDATGLPFDFTGGYVGYFGYEMKADCGSANRHRSPTPDAAWLFADRVIAVDHEEGFTYAVCLAEDTPQAAREAADWLEGVLAGLSCVTTERPSLPAPPAPADPGAAEPWLVRDRATYLADIEACRQALRSGTSYEVCLTNAARLAAPPDPLEFYRTLRRDNPAPYAAFLRFGELEVAGSSPERFLRIDRDGTAEARPIKGTAPRGDGPEEDARLRDALASDAKTRAENLMIVDLLRNDLGQVCRTGTVRVSKLMATETYATVHQLVSTVEGRLRPGTDAVDCVRACFPGGSMTGAPKLRTLEIIDTLETEARGVYSGALGYFGCGGGADLSIVIRTAVFADGLMHLGAGGAIVLGSDPDAEYEEMLLKTAAPMRALHRHTADRMRQEGPPGQRAGAAEEVRR